MKINQMSVFERPREKLLLHGGDKLSDTELLAVLLNTGCYKMSAIQLASRLIEEFGTLQAISIASKRKLLGIKGLGEAKYAVLQAALELSSRSLEQSMLKRATFTKVSDSMRYLRSKLSKHQKEVFSVLLLDNQHQFLAYKELFFGTINSAAVYPREIVKQAIEDNASALILAHNHPSGVAEPSEADILVTKKIVQALALVDVMVLDHVVVGHDNAVSFAERGLLG